MDKKNILFLLLAPILLIVLALSAACRGRPTENTGGYSPQGDGAKAGTKSVEVAGSASQLKQRAQEFAALLETGKSADLGHWISREGVSIGVDTDPISVTLVQQQVGEQKGIFCLLFDTECLRKNDREKRKQAHAASLDRSLYSYWDLLRKSRSKKLDTYEQQTPTGHVGRLTIRIENGDQIKDNETLEMEFMFVPEGDSWKLSAILFD